MFALLTAAASCVGSAAPPPDQNSLRQTVAAAAPTPTTTLPPGPLSASTASGSLLGVPTSTPSSVPQPPPTVTATPFLGIHDPLEARVAEEFATFGQWQTDFTKRSVSLLSIDPIVPRDRITPIDAPQFTDVAAAPAYMRDNEPVIAFESGGTAKAYPLAMLIWHEIVNDTVGGKPVTVTFCPLCNSSLVFDRSVDGRRLSFGTSGNLRHSDLVMWDRQTQSWWQQITGEAIVGTLTGTQLDVLPSAVISWKAFRELYPEGELLLRVTEDDGSYARDYDNPPYAGYDDVRERPFLFVGTADGRLPAVARVVTLQIAETSVAYPFDFLSGNPVINDSVGGQDIVIMFDDSVASPFTDASLAPQISGGATVFSRQAGAGTLMFVSSAARKRTTGAEQKWATGSAIGAEGWPVSAMRLGFGRRAAGR